MESSSEMVPFPLLMTPVESNYRACTIPYRFDSDNPRKPTPTEILWIDLFLNSVPSFRSGKLVAVRDPHGFRPLAMGRRTNGAVIFASETKALDIIEAHYERRELNPGEALVVDTDGIRSFSLPQLQKSKVSRHERIYNSLPFSVISDISIFEFRYALGEILAIDAGTTIPTGMGNDE